MWSFEFTSQKQRRVGYGDTAAGFNKQIIEHEATSVLIYID